MSIVRSLTEEAILGLNFLQDNRAVIDLDKQQLTFIGFGDAISLGKNYNRTTGMVFAIETVLIPPCSELEVMGQVQDMPDGKIWLWEESPGNQLPTSVARALVSSAELVPVRLLNHRSETVTVHRCQKLAVVEEVESPPEIPVSSVVTNNNGITREKQELLYELTKASSNDLTTVQTQQLYELLLLYADVFACGNNDVGRTNKIQYTIHTDAPPIRQAVRRLPPAKRQEVQKLLKDMQEKDVIEPSACPWASPIVLVRKKDGSTRFCVDYRKLNSVSRKDAYPLPRIDDTLDALAGAQWFSTLDLISGY